MATTYTDCITFTGETSEFTLKAQYKEWNGTVEYSTDHQTWTVWDGSAISSSGKKLYLRGSGNTTFRTSSGARFVLSARAACSGNIQTLLQYNNPPTSISASYCYAHMFNGCSNLTQAPELTATTLADYCYYYMFRNCTSLTQAPELPATTLASNCYYSIFDGCTSLTQAPALPATTLASNCYRQMFSLCSSLKRAPELPATKLASACYQEMFSYCSSLTRAPELPAITLANYCYNRMFYACSSLKISSTQSSEYPTTWRIPSSGTISSTPTSWNTDMLSSTGGTFKSNPSINTTYYGAWSLVETYNITYNLTNCTGASSNPTTIDEGTTATLSFTSNNGYSFPDTITVSGVESYTWDKSTGTLTLTNATSDVSITITCIVAYPKINSFTYYGKQINKINGKPIRYVHYSGNTYEMVYLDANGNYLRDANGYVLQDSGGNYLEFTEELATPQNVTANGTTVSWDDVENATSYAVLADGTSLGTVEGTTQDSSYIVTIDDVTNDEYDYIQISVTCNGEQISSGDSVAKNAQIHITYTANFASVTVGLVINGVVVNEVWSPAIGEYDYTVTSDTHITWV